MDKSHNLTLRTLTLNKEGVKKERESIGVVKNVVHNLLPYKSQTQVSWLLSANLTCQCSFNHVDFSLVTFSIVSPLVSFK